MVHHITEQQRYVGSYGRGQSLYRVPQCDEKEKNGGKVTRRGGRLRLRLREGPGGKKS